MRLHQWHSIGWVVICLLFVLWEVIGLANATDANKPFTYFVRKIAGNWTNPMWFLIAGFLVWLFVHFLFVHEH